jgi:hypothetical protein
VAGLFRTAEPEPRVKIKSLVGEVSKTDENPILFKLFSLGEGCF